MAVIETNAGEPPPVSVTGRATTSLVRLMHAITQTAVRSEIVGGVGAVAVTLLLYIACLKFEVIDWLYRSDSVQYGLPLHKAVVLIVCLSAAFFLLAIRRSVQLDSEIKKREAAEAEAHTLARYDVLTGLSNRTAFSEELERAIGRTGRGLSACAVLLIDLDKFKPVNDIHGHAAGDAVLREISRRLKSVVRRPEALARLGGDEFAVVIEHPLGGDAPVRLAKRLIAAASQPIELGGVSIEIGATIGIAACPADGVDGQALLHAAGIALDRAKHEERGACRFFEPSMDTEIRTRAALEADMRRAISVGEIRPYFQPIVDLKKQSLLGFEVLARWRHPTKGLLPPDLFIPIAEDCGLSGDLTYALLRQACLEAVRWPDHLTLAVNVSPGQLKDRWLPQRILAILTQTGFPARRLEVEITENALVADIDAARAVLSSLQNLGIKISLDDFGTGYSSLYHLRELNFDKIKIDKSFVMTMRDSEESSKIVDAILGLSKSLGMTTTAEGIETVASLDRLTAMGCDFGQGYHFAKPLTAEEAGALCNRRPEEIAREIDLALTDEPKAWVA